MTVRVASLVDLWMAARSMRADEVLQFAALFAVDTVSPDVVANFMFNSSEKYALIDGDGSLILVMGGDEILPGIWQPWMAGSEKAWKEHGLIITRAARRMIHDKLKEGVRRVQLQVLESRTEAREWYERFLGMTQEGVHPDFGANGETVVTYAITRKQLEGDTDGQQ